MIHRLVGLSARTGETVWRTPLAVNSKLYYNQDVCTLGRYRFCLVGGKHVVRIDGETGELLVKEVSFTATGNLLLLDSSVYVVGYDGALAVYRLNDELQVARRYPLKTAAGHKLYNAYLYPHRANVGWAATGKIPGVAATLPSGQ